MLNIYVNTWGNYNENGADGGEWLSLPLDPELLEEELERIAEEMGDFDPEWFINDYEWTTDESLGEVHEMDNIEDLNELCNRLDNLDETEKEVLMAYIDCHSNDINEALECIEKGNYTFYSGWDLEDVAIELVNECYFTKDTPEFLKRYFDYDAFARDLGFDGYMETKWGVLYVQ